MAAKVVLEKTTTIPNTQIIGKKYSEINNEKKNIIVKIKGIFFIFILYKKISKIGKKI